MCVFPPNTCAAAVAFELCFMSDWVGLRCACRAVAPTLRRRRATPTCRGTRSSAQGNCSEKSLAPVMSLILHCPPCLLRGVGGGVQQGMGVWQGEGVGGMGRGVRGRGQLTFHPPCHTLHYHMVLRPEGTSHNNRTRSSAQGNCVCDVPMSVRPFTEGGGRVPPGMGWDKGLLVKMPHTKFIMVSTTWCCCPEGTSHNARLKLEDDHRS